MSLVAVPYPILDGKGSFTIYTFNEPTFNDYKSLVKQLANISDPRLPTDYKTEIFLTFAEKLFSKNIHFCNCIQIFYLLVYTRSLVLGNTFNFKLGEKLYEYSIENVLRDIEALDSVPHDRNFNIPTGFWTTDTLNCISKCLNIRESELEDSEYPLTTLYKAVIDFSKQYNIFFPTKDNPAMTLNFHDGSYTYFLHSLYMADLKHIFEFEHLCMQRLQLKGDDFNHYTYPELKIHLNLQEEAHKKANLQNEQR